MTSKAKWDELKLELEDHPEVLVGGDMIPYGQPHILVIGSSKTNLDTAVLSAQLKDYVGLPNFPLAKGSPNYYPFVILLYEGEPNLYNSVSGKFESIPVVVDSIEDWVEGADVAFVMAQPLEGTNEDILAELQEEAKDQIAPSDDPGNPIIIPENQTLDPTGWVNLRIHFSDMAPLSTAMIKIVLQNAGYKVLAPDRGITGIFVKTTSVMGKHSTSVFFNPDGAMVTGEQLQAGVFNVHGEVDGVPRAIVALFTSETTMNNQQVLDIAWRTQESTQGATDLLEALLGILNKILKALPIIVWVAIGGVVLFGSWQLYKYIRDQRGKKSLITRRLER